MARDLFVELKRCAYCGRPAEITWEDDLFSCRQEVCKTLAYGEMKRRQRERVLQPARR